MMIACVLSLSAEAWAAAGKAPGSTPGGLSEFFLMALLGTIAVLALAAAGILLVRLNRLKSQWADSKNDSGLTKKPYRMMVENADQGILVLQELELKYANQAVYDLMGMSIDESDSTHIADYLYPEDLDIVLESYEKIIFNKEKIRNFSARAIKTDESVIWINARFVPITWEGAPAVLAFLRDVTAQKMLEQDLQQAQRMEAIGALSGGIAHDFNNILTTIIGNAEVAMMDLEETDPQAKEFEQIRKSGYRARDLVRQILTISRENAQDVQPLYLTPMIKEAMKLLRSTLPKEIKIQENFEKKLKLVKADSIQMYQVFMNLCTNARDALKGLDNPCLEVVLENEQISRSGQVVPSDLKPGSYVVFSVRDNGAGIDATIADHIFEPYFSTKDSKSGTGLGLATALGIVKQYGGTINYDTSEKGSCFKVYLPVHEPEAEGNQSAPEDSGTRAGKVLFVDDEPEITMVAERMLKNLGFSVMTANSGRKALEAFSRSPEFFDLLITDLSMPGMSGDALAKAALRIRPGIPVIICTGHSDTFNAAAAKKAGISAYVEKPYDFKSLSSLASSFIKKTKAA